MNQNNKFDLKFDLKFLLLNPTLWYLVKLKLNEYDCNWKKKFIIERLVIIRTFFNHKYKFSFQYR